MAKISLALLVIAILSTRLVSPANAFDGLLETGLCEKQEGHLWEKSFIDCYSSIVLGFWHKCIYNINGTYKDSLVSQICGRIGNSTYIWSVLLAYLNFICIIAGTIALGVWIRDICTLDRVHT